MPIEPSNITPAQRGQFLDFLRSLGGQSAVSAGLEVLARLDSGQPLIVEAPTHSGITLRVPPQLFAQLPAGVVTSGVPAGDYWKWILKLLECGLKNIGLALQGKWVEFATAVLTCVFGT
jgi:hypothetical protein